MKKYSVSAFVALVAIAYAEGEDLVEEIVEEENKECLLSTKPPDKPFPSLSFCFRNNVEACCLTAHDGIIKDNYGGFMPDACSSGFILFEQLQCLGCHPMQPLVVETFATEARKQEFKEANPDSFREDDNIVGKVELCRNFVELLYLDAKSEDVKTLDEPTTKFDDCGFLNESSSTGV